MRNPSEWASGWLAWRCSARGTTAVLDPEVPAHLVQQVAAATGEIGIRAGLAVAVASGAGYGASSHSQGHHHHSHAGSDSLDLADPEFPEFVRRWRRDNQERVGLWLGLRVLSGADRRLGEALSGAMERHRLPLTFHCAEQRADVEAVREGTGLGTLDYAESLGLLGPATVISHGVHLDESDLGVLQRTADVGFALPEFELADRAPELPQCCRCSLVTST